MKKKLDRRTFLNTLSAGGVSIAIGFQSNAAVAALENKPAILGGPKAHGGVFPPGHFRMLGRRTRSLKL